MKLRPLIALGLLLALPLTACPSAQEAPALLTSVDQSAQPAAAPTTPDPVMVAAVKKKKKAICQDCGTITDIQNASDAKRVTGGGAVIGAVIGGLIGNQAGKDLGQGNKTRTAGTVAGVAAGAYTGHQIEKDVKDHRYFRIRVKMDNGSIKRANVEDTGSLKVGSRVRIVGSDIRPL